MNPGTPWMVSLHGGHSSRYCDHADNSLRELLDAAVDRGYRTFGVTEHAPRTQARYLYDEEIERGWGVGTIDSLFREYALELDVLRDEYCDRLCVLKGFEAEIVPPGQYPQIMLDFKRNLNFDFIVGSVHYVDDIIIDYKPASFRRALEHCGGYENLAVRYYGAVTEMVTRLKPEVVGHFDIVKKGLGAEGATESQRVLTAAGGALEVIRDANAILDINTAGYRKGMGCPFPSREYIRIAHDLGIPMCFGDDSHSVTHVGMDIGRTREYLLQEGVTRITTLTRSGSGLEREEIPLQE